MTKANWLRHLLIAFLSIWLGWTVLVDFFVVPSIFRIIPNFFKAGELAMLLFSQLNNLELIVSSGVLLLVAMQFKLNRSNIFIFLFSFFVWSIVMFYFSFLTPKIINLTEMWMSAGSEIGKFKSLGIIDIQQEHQRYHNLYRSLDSIKLVLLIILFGLAMKKQNKWL